MPLVSTAIAKLKPTPTLDMWTAFSPLHINLAMRTSLPVLAPSELHGQEIIHSPCLFAQPMKLLAFHFPMPRHLALRAEHSVAAGTLRRRHRHRRCLVDDRRRAVHEGAEDEFVHPQDHGLAQGVSPALQRLFGEEITACLWLQRRVAVWLWTRHFGHVVLEFCGDVARNAIGAEEVGAAAAGEHVGGGFGVRTDGARGFGSRGFAFGHY